MGGKSSKSSIGSASTPATPSTSGHHRTASVIPVLGAPGLPSTLSPRRGVAVDGKLQLLDHVYHGIAASVILSKAGELIYGRGLDAAAATELRNLFPRFVTCLSGFERSVDDSDVRCLHIYGALRCFSCFRMDDKHFLLFFTAPVEATPRASASVAVRSVAQHSALQDEKVKLLCAELRQLLVDSK